MLQLQHGPCLFVRKARAFLFWAILLVALLSASCARNSPPPSKESQPNRSEKIACVDAVGRSVELPRHPRRIISLAPSVTEVLYMLGAGDRIIGDTTYCDWPEDARRKPKVGDLLNPNYELILAAKPDLVIASTAGNDQNSVFKLAELGVRVYVCAPRSLDGIFETVKAIGRITDCTPQAEQVVTRMRDRLDDVHRRLAGTPATRAFLVTWFDPLLAPGKNTFENDVLRQAGAESITAGINEYYPRYSLEKLLAEDPDVILTVRHEGTPLPDLAHTAGWKQLRAVRSGRFYEVSETLQHPSPRFVDSVEELARKLHPERFR